MANTYLTKTYSTQPTNSRIGTFSFWIKFSGLSTSADKYLFSTYENSNDRTLCKFNTSCQLEFQARSGGNLDLRYDTNRIFRDTNAWYNIVIATDTTQSTAADRVKIYVNGVQETSFATSTVPSQNVVPHYLYGGIQKWIGVYGNSLIDKWDGLMSHLAFIDGTQELPTIFGETDSTTGEWKIKTNIVPSSAWGTNGYWILKDGNTVTDSSSNSNAWTVGGGTLTKSEDSPSNVFATMNPLFNPDPSNPLGSMSNGNLSFTTNSTSSSSMGVTTFGAKSGKFYSEIKFIGESGTGEAFAGIGYDIYDNATSSFNADSSFMWNVCSNGDAKFGGSGQGAGNWSNTYAANDIISIAMDLDNNRVYFAKNGQYADGSGNWDEAFTGSPAYVTITSDKTYFFCAGDKSGSQTASWSCNFGNGTFVTTAVSSAGTNASGNGIFEYDVPTGYTALSTKGLNL